MKEEPFIVDIKRNSLDDGPGIRTLLFFKGCPLSCVWCQNPETKRPVQEISFDGEKCIGCGKCLEVCSRGTIDFNYEYRIHREDCSLCGDCIDACKNNALEYVGKLYTVDQLLESILKDKVFFDNSGGGVTFSGGEPLYHMNYLHGLLLKLKEHDIHVCVETSGFYNRNQFEELILPLVDLVYFDLKIYDPKKHAQYCQVSNEIILKNFEHLITINNVEVLPRIPLIPGITDTDENLRDWRSYLKSLNIRKVGLLPYNPLWLVKPQKLGIKPGYSHSEWLGTEKKKKIKEIFSDFEFKDF